MQVLALAVLIAQLFIGKTSPGALPLQDSRFGKTVPIFYTVSDTNVESQVLSFLKAFGDNHVLVYPRDSENYTAADLTDMPNNDETTHIVGISFDKVDFESKSLLLRFELDFASHIVLFLCHASYPCYHQG